MTRRATTKFSLEVEAQLKECLPLIEGSRYCPSKVRQFLEGIEVREGVPLAEAILNSALTLAEIDSDPAQAFDEEVAAWIPELFKYQINGTAKRGRMEIAWDCTECSFAEWVLRYDAMKPTQNQISVEFGNIVAPELVALMERHFTRSSTWDSEPGQEICTFSPNNKIEQDLRGIYGKERPTAKKASMGKVLGAPLLRRIDKAAHRHAAVCDVARRLTLFTGEQLIFDDEGKPWLQKTLSSALDVFEQEKELPSAFARFFKSIFDALAQVWNAHVSGESLSGQKSVWRCWDESFTHWVTANGIHTVSVCVESGKRADDDLASYRLSSHVFSRRELVLLGIPLPGMSVPLDVFKDPLCPQQ